MESVRTNSAPFGLQPSAASAWTRAALGVAAPALERLLGLHRLGRMYAEATGNAVVDDFPERALEHLGIGWRVDANDLARVPLTGPLVVVANHPFGAADGLVLLALLRRVRRDVRLLGNYLLQRIPEMTDLVIGVDPFGGRDARADNQRMVRRAADWARRGGVVVIFPAGEVSASRAPGGRLIDRPWKRGAARIVAESGAAVLPMYFEGRNGRVFEWAGRVHPGLRTALLPRELLARAGQTLTPTVGAAIPHDVLAPMDDRTMLRYLRASTYGLRANEREPETPPSSTRTALPSAAAGCHATAADVARLPAERVLASSRDLQVMYAGADEIPAVLQEIGRLRELTFRAVGEGTGQAVDLDRFDRHYLHLFIWHRGRRELVGAYRLGQSDRILAERGLGGFYTRTLFRYGRHLLDRLGPSLELGRSFVRPEYQREFGPLLLLWQGIGRFAARHPRYRRLFGAVSITAGYRPAARDLIISALESMAGESPYARLAAGRRRYRSLTGAEASTLVDEPASAHALINEIDPSQRGIPVLLRQYLKLGATPLATSVDPAFSNAVDALMVVDLDLVSPGMLSRYMGTDGVAAFQPAQGERRRAS